MIDVIDAATYALVFVAIWKIVDVIHGAVIKRLKLK